MTIQVRPITIRESEMLDRWQRLDDILRYRRARILRLSQEEWKCSMIAEALLLQVETVRQVITAFNQGGIPAITQGLFYECALGPREGNEAAGRILEQQWPPL